MILIFDLDSKGHHLEYIHHLYMYAYSKLREDVLFLLHSDFESKLQYRDFPAKEGLNFVFIKQKDDNNWRKYKILSSFLKSYLLKKYTNIYNPSAVFLPEVVSYFPWLIFNIINRNLISAIEYRIPGRRMNNISLKQRITDSLKLKFYVYAPCFHRIFLLNDKSYADIYNKRYKTVRFSYLPDPIVKIENDGECTASLFNVETKGKKVFLHCGGMSTRKGTFTILDSIRKLSIDDRKEVVFIFAGRIAMNEKEEFKSQIKELSHFVNIFFFEGFLSFQNLAELFKHSNYILVPYKNVEQSSGIIGHAAQYGKPVIGPAEGLLGFLISEYGLGYTISNLNADKLSEKISQLLKEETHVIDGASYLREASAENFARIIYEVCTIKNN